MMCAGGHAASQRALRTPLPLTLQQNGMQEIAAACKKRAVSGFSGGKERHPSCQFCCFDSIGKHIHLHSGSEPQGLGAVSYKHQAFEKCDSRCLQPRTCGSR
eukprot:483411-Rhodomonas_salina.1